MPKAMSVSVVDWLNTDVPQVARQALIDAVSREQARVEAEQASRSGIGVSPQLEMMIIDGKRGAHISEIRATSRVILDWNYIVECVIKAVEGLRVGGPERTGDWKKSIVLLLDGHEHPVGESIPADTAQAMVAVTVPYARKLEVGRTESGRPFSIQVQQHYVESTMMRLRSDLRDLAKLSFQWIDLAGAHLLSARGQHRRDFSRGRARLGSKRHGETATRFPAIIIDEIKAI